MKLKYIVQKNNTNISPRLHLFLPPPRRWTWVGRLREMYDSHFPVGLLLFSAFFSLPLLLFFSSSFFLFFFFHSYSSSWWLSSPPLFFFFSSPSRYNSILTHPCRIDYCFRPASTAAVQQSSSSSNPSPGLRCNYPRLALQSTTQVLPAKKKKKSSLRPPGDVYYLRGDRKKYPPSSARRWSQPAPLLLPSPG